MRTFPVYVPPGTLLIISHSLTPSLHLFHLSISSKFNLSIHLSKFTLPYFHQTPFYLKLNFFHSNLPSLPHPSPAKLNSTPCYLNSSSLCRAIVRSAYSNNSSPELFLAYLTCNPLPLSFTPRFLHALLIELPLHDRQLQFNRLLHLLILYISLKSSPLSWSFLLKIILRGTLLINSFIPHNNSTLLNPSLLPFYHALWQGIQIHLPSPQIPIKSSLSWLFIVHIHTVSPSPQSLPQLKPLLHDIFSFIFPSTSQTCLYSSILYFFSYFNHQRHSLPTDFPSPSSLSPCLGYAIACLNPDNLYQNFPQLTHQMLIHENLINRIPKRFNVGETSLFSHWLTLLRSAVLLNSPHLDSINMFNWSPVLNLLANHVDPIDILNHFIHISDTKICLYLVNHWVPRYLHSNPQLVRSIQSSVSQKFSPPLTPSLDYTQVFLQFINCHLDNGTNRYRRALKDIFDIILAKYNVIGLFKFTQELRSHKIFVWPSVIARCLSDADSITRQRKNSSLPSSKPSIENWLQYLKLHLQHGVSPSYIFFLLNVKVGKTMLCQQNLASPHHNNQVLSDDRNHLIHLLAWNFALDYSKSPKSCFRNVYTCYRYLRDRNSPINTLIVKSFIHAGITRNLFNSNSLKNNLKFIDPSASNLISFVQDSLNPKTQYNPEFSRFIPSDVYNFIINLVRQIEGIQVAEQLEFYFLKWINEEAWQSREIPL